jgi:hypothetical protein
MVVNRQSVYRYIVQYIVHTAHRASYRYVPSCSFLILLLLSSVVVVVDEGVVVAVAVAVAVVDATTF